MLPIICLVRSPYPLPPVEAKVECPNEVHIRGEQRGKYAYVDIHIRFRVGTAAAATLAGVAAFLIRVLLVG